MSTVGKGSQVYSGFSPTSIPGCMLWLDAADATSVTLSTGSNVSSWRDKSGRGCNTTSSTGTVTFPANSNGLFFDGGSSLFLPNDTLPIGNTSYSYFFMFTSTDSSLQLRNILTAGSTANGQMFAIRNAGTGSGRVNTYWYNFDLGTTNAYTVNQRSFVATYYQSGGERSVWVNFVQGAVDTPGTRSQTNANNRIGHGPYDNPWLGFMHEIIVYSNALSTFERQQVEGYLAAKWGLAASLPAAHPYYWPQLLSSPTSISGCALWLDGADRSTMTFSGANITQWNDKSGNARHTHSVTGTPTWGTNTVNNRSGVYFNGGAYFYGDFTYSSSNLSCFLVGTIESSSRSDSRLLSFSTSTLNDLASSLTMNALSRLGTTTEIISYRNGFIGRNMNITYGTPFLVESIINGSSNLAFINGNSATGGATSGNFGFTRYAIANMDGTNSQQNTGFIFEVLVYAAALSTTQRQQVEVYLANKWGLAASLPALPPELRVIAKPLSLRPFSPLDISGCQLWFDGADRSTMTFSGANITQWNDKSGNARHLTTFTTVGPTYESNAFGTQSAPLYARNDIRTPAFVMSPTQDLTVCIVLKSTSVAGGNYDTFVAGDYRIFDLLGQLNGGWIVMANASFQYTIVGGNTSNVPYNLGVVISNNAITTFANGTSGGGGGGGSGFPLSTNSAWILGGNFRGYMGELVVYSRAISASQRQQIEGYLAAKWGLRGTLPSTHPFKLADTLSVPFNPAQIPGCQLWLDAADTNTITLSGSTLTGWTDKSGTSRTITINTAPTYSATSFGGLPGLTFSGSSRLSSTLSSGLGQNMTLAVVCIVTSSSGNNMPLSVGTNTTDSGITWRNDLLRFVVFDYGFGESQNSTITTINSRAAVVGVKSASSPNLISVVNGSAAPTANSTYSNASTQVNIGNGGSFGFTGVISEILIISTALTVDRRQQLEGYLTWKWGLRTSIPATHPYSRFNPS